MSENCCKTEKILTFRSGVFLCIHCVVKLNNNTTNNYFLAEIFSVRSFKKIEEKCLNRKKQTSKLKEFKKIAHYV